MRELPQLRQLRVLHLLRVLLPLLLRVLLHRSSYGIIFGMLWKSQGVKGLCFREGNRL